MLTQARLTLKLHAFSTAAVSIAVLALAAACVIVVSHLQGTGATVDCIRGWLSSGPVIDAPAPACQAAVARFLDVSEHEAGQLMGPLTLLPLVAGIIAGVALIGREIEERTASIAWSLAPSRSRWAAARILPVGLVLLVVLVVLSLAGSELARVREPWVDPGRSFDLFGQRGWIVVGTGLLAFGAAVLCGAVIGRVLPALIVATVVSFALLSAVDTVKTAWLPTQSVIVNEQGFNGMDGSIWLEQLQRLPSGELRPMPGLVAIGAAGGDGKAPDPATPDPNAPTIVSRVVPGSKYQTVEAFETGLLVVIAGGLLGASWIVVRRRRPA